MKHSFHPLSLMLIGIILFHQYAAAKFNNIHKGLGHWRLAARSQPDSTSTFLPADPPAATCSPSSCAGGHPYSDPSSCLLMNGATLIAGTNDQKWTMLCNVDFFAQDLLPFISAGSFDECLKSCDSYNQEKHKDRCFGFVFAPDRIDSNDDCYLKSSLNNVISPSAVHLVGAVLDPGSVLSTTSSAKPTASVDANNKQSDDNSQLKFPENLKIKQFGSSSDTAVKQYVSHVPELPAKLAAKLLKPGINIDLVTKYPLASDTGSWTELSAPLSDLELSNLTITPRLSRDGGKGGNINGTHVFYFCDTATFGEVQGPLGYMNGFVSSSAAIDVSRRVLDGGDLELTNPIGQWQDDVGRLRGFIPLTTGEESFNVAVSGDGFRYAIWPESSFIPLNETHSLVYAPIVYVQVDMKTQHADFTSLGNTLVLISIDPTYGPHGDRIISQMFNQDEVEWGSLGGLRAWTKTGKGSNDGMIYLFGQATGGILVAKVPATQIRDRAAYTYWNGTSWSSTMQSKDSTAFMVAQPVMDVDVFYIPACKCFAMIYLTPYADNNFYIRVLQQTNILPPYMPGGSDDYVENILRHKWSEPRVLYKAPVPAQGYIYAGGVHLGYFGDQDISNGGWKLLITWTEHTPVDPNNPASGYAHKYIIFE